MNCLVDHVENLEFKLVHMERLQEKAGRLEEEVKRMQSECLFLMQKLDGKEKELQESNSNIEKLEESISSMTLESQCEIESMKLDMVAMEQCYLETKKVQEEAFHLTDKMSRLIGELQNAEKTIESLEKENEELRRELDMSTRNASTFFRRVDELIEDKERSQNTMLSSNDRDSELTSFLDTRYFCDINLKILGLCLWIFITLGSVLEHHYAPYLLLHKAFFITNFYGFSFRFF